MKPLYSEDEFNAAKSRDLLPLECLHCHSSFLRGKNIILCALKGIRNVTFCSHSCRDKHYQTSIDISCCQCGKTFRKMSSAIKKTKHNFCCKSHAAKYHNAHKKGGCRISKLEKWLQAELSLLFPNLEFHFNRVDAIKAELDIYVPSLRLAFELNGIFHYEPIFGADKLSTIQSNDQRKFVACAEQGIGLCILDVSRESYFKPSKAQKYLDIITGIIRTKLSGDSQAPSLELPDQNHVEVP